MWTRPPTSIHFLSAETSGHGEESPPRVDAALPEPAPAAGRPRIQPSTEGNSPMPLVSQFFFRSAILFLIAGIAIGLHMGISQDHSATGAHVHINLLGWVTSALFGGYYALNPIKAGSTLALVHFVAYTLGVLVMTPSLYLTLTGIVDPSGSIVGALVASSFTIFGAVLLFAVIVFRGDRATSPAADAPLTPRHAEAAGEAGR